MRAFTRLGFAIATVLAVGLLSGCGPHGFHDGTFAQHVLLRLDDWADALNLNDEQRESYRELRGKMETALIEQGEERKLAFSRLREEINNENPDPNRITAILKGRVQELSAFVDQNMDILLQFYNVLDANQQARVMAKVQKRFNRIDRFMDES